MDVVYFSLTSDNVRSHFQFRVLEVFFRHWVNLFAHSFNARLLWRERTGQSMKSHSVTRWWSKWEILKQVSDFVGEVVPLLHKNQNLSPVTCQHLFEILAWRLVQ